MEEFCLQTTLELLMSSGDRGILLQRISFADGEERLSTSEYPWKASLFERANMYHNCFGPLR